MQIQGVLTSLLSKICLVEKQNKQIISRMDRASKVGEKQIDVTCQESKEEKIAQKKNFQSDENDQHLEVCSILIGNFYI